MADTLWGDDLPPEVPVTAPERREPPRNAAYVLSHKSKDGTNPCLKVFGPGPEGAKCKTCKFLYAPGGTQGVYYKCRKRGTPTGGPGTDHKVRWPACAKYEKAED